jgi:membrane associated rhomboid family serine protease
MRTASTRSLAFWLAVACVAAAVVSGFATQGAPVLKLRPARIEEEPWTALTFLFVGRGDWLGAIFAAACLYHFGREVERHLGVIRFAGLVVTAALAAAALGFAAALADVGASGAVAAGVIIAYMRLWPLNRVSLFGTSAMSARDILIGYVGLSLLASFGGGQLRWEGLVPVAGVAATLLFLMVVEHDSAGAKFRAKLNTALYGEATWSREEIDWQSVPRDGLHELTVHELDRVEAKAQRDGVRSLTADERAFVHRLRLRRTA